ncbi:AP-5 complex subunit mu (Adaptor protein complex AP-5 subunit mu) (Adaptor protein-5 mu-adaptin) (Adaptor-related protein complex 5 subunit mu) (Mu5-adaptin) [Durusdinium trenchii]|uniref:AP-5 complex subunit mu (Adaptor protein complex AP-5 subunit mu) (Adaptor protein-5 mu-adaptin) (Adaptor-related protein complex 5 subunit mu) (Mu5-adaptin) n=1 Tax=Durusdinium trenchii TaxID=1381693 RepID=A0ABP0J8A4_9DINO
MGPMTALMSPGCVVTAAFAVLEDICDFIPANLSISDVAGISELQYYIRSALPFGSPVNTNFHLLRMVRHGFPNKEDDTSQRSPAWKPYLYKGKPKLTLSVVETVNCTLYGKSEYEDECFIQGTVYCCADIAGVPEVCVPISFQPTAPGGDDSSQSRSEEISVHNCAHIIGGIKSAKDQKAVEQEALTVLRIAAGALLDLAKLAAPELAAERASANPPGVNLDTLRHLSREGVWA